MSLKSLLFVCSSRRSKHTWFITKYTNFDLSKEVTTQTSSFFEDTRAEELRKWSWESGVHLVEVSLAVYTLHAGAGSVSNYGGRDFRHRHKMSQSNAGLGLAGT